MEDRQFANVVVQGSVYAKMEHMKRVRSMSRMQSDIHLTVFVEADEKMHLVTGAAFRAKHTTELVAR